MYDTIPDLPPSAPANPSPAPGVSGVGPMVLFCWDACRDPEGGEVTYNFMLGTTLDKISTLFTNIRTPECKIMLADGPERVYFWRIQAVDKLGNLTWGPLWSFKSVGHAGTTVPGPIVLTEEIHQPAAADTENLDTAGSNNAEDSDISPGSESEVR